MPRYTHRTRIDAPAAEVFRWHARPGAFERLLPPWEAVEVVERTGGIRDGDRVMIRSRVGPLWTRWVVEHRDYIEGVQFRDVQIAGPFRNWEHTHRVIPDGPHASTLEDEIEYQLPLGAPGRLLGNALVKSKLERMFRYRHAVTRADVEAHHAAAQSARLRVLVSGSTGLVGANLVSLLTTGGHEAIQLVRRSSTTPQRDTAVWDTDTGRITCPEPETIDAVVHLAGAPIAGRWTARHKQRIRDTRLDGTRQIVEWMARLEKRPRTFVCASAIGYYGARGDEYLTERSTSGTGFLANVCHAWEDTAAQARAPDTRVVCARLGIVLSPRGGALANLMTPFRLGLGGPIGNGRQFWSWVSIDDAAGALLHALQYPTLEGPVNVVSPTPVTNREFARTLGAVLNRPALAPLPALAARTILGEMADELLLSSQRVAPARLRDTQYRFRHETLGAGLRHLFGKPDEQP